MKKFCYLILFVFAISSCSSDTNSTEEPNPNLLQRVDFFPNSQIERRWLFNSNGLLQQITKADGTIVQDFTYDDNNRLTSSTLINDNGINETHTFTYDSNGFVSSVDGAVVNFISTQNAYYTGDLNQSYRLTKINNEKLLLEGRTVTVDNDETGTQEIFWSEMQVVYSNNNITSFFPDESCSFFTYDNKNNPLRNATLAICRAFSFIPNSRWLDGQFNSYNNPITQNYCTEDPESHVFQYTYNSNNLPMTQTRDDYYLGVYEYTTTSAKYYYQGDVLP